MTNKKGDTALHVAARAGKLNPVRILVNITNHLANKSYSLLKIINNKGNTALHEVLLTSLNGNKDAERKENADSIMALARSLVSADPEVCYRQNNAGKSPLCLAGESENNDILEFILKAVPGGVSLIHKLEGKSPVHVAIEQRNSSNSSGGALERNKGLYPIHVACRNGHVRVVRELLTKWPEPSELLCNKERNILHLAAQWKPDVVRCILLETKGDKLVNEMDNEGNTPLQLAASHCCSLVVGLLLMDKRAKSDMVNHQGHRAYDIAKHRQALAYNILPADKATTNSRKQNVPAVKAVDGRIGIGESMEASGDNVKHSTEVLDSHSKKSREPNLYGMVD
ncbi:ankyrin repeat family protein [Melia azedarach]|uniref:Ankyrin repeat family protein n=1 Tax=Melia azedarach TaxID=155640 RepID=A0ACC1Z271_MELAZ|nr:ankyrin repeat family protein [Melia azedarach]